MSSIRLAIALGSNLGDRADALTWAVGQLGTRLRTLRVSSYIDTEPEGVVGDQPRYLNAAATGETDTGPEGVLAWLLELEAARGRRRHVPWAPRTLDLDLILYGDRVVDQPGLVVPHPRFRARRFVLEPLAEIAPEMIDPVTGKRVDELLRALRT